MEEKQQLLEKLNNTDERIDSWHNLTVRAFDFACYARYWYNNGDLKTKTAILGALGSNLRIYDRSLLIDGQKYWFIIKKGKEDIYELAKKFEPEKWLDILQINDLQEVFCSSWLFIGEEARTLVMASTLI